MAHCFALKGNNCIQRNILISLFDILKFRPCRFHHHRAPGFDLELNFIFIPLVASAITKTQTQTLEHHIRLSVEPVLLVMSE